jgi:hypothetical protein
MSAFDPKRSAVLAIDMAGFAEVLINPVVFWH